MNVFRRLFNREDPFLIQFAVLNLVGLWHLDTDDKRVRIIYGIYRFLALLTLTSLLFLEINDIASLRQDQSRVAERLCAASTTCIITMRTYLLMHYSPTIYQIQDKLTEFRETKCTSPEAVKVLQKSSEKVIKAAKAFYIGAVLGLTFWLIHPKFYADRRLPFPITLPIDIQKSPYYELLYLYLIVILIMFTASVVSTILGFGSYLTMINAQFGVLKTLLESISRERENVVKNKYFWTEFNTGKYTRAKNQTPHERELEDKRIKDIKTKEILAEAIETHKFIFDEIDSFRRLHNKHLLAHITGILFGVAVIETTGLTDDFTIHMLKRCLVLFLGIIDLFLICLFGEELQHKSCEIAETLYMIPWHETDIDIQKIILIMTIRSRRPCILKAGSTIRLNLATFLNLMRVAYNFVLLLRHTILKNT